MWSSTKVRPHRSGRRAYAWFAGSGDQDRHCPGELLLVRGGHQARAWMKAASGTGKADNKVKPAVGRDQFVGGRGDWRAGRREKTSLPGNQSLAPLCHLRCGSWLCQDSDNRVSCSDSQSGSSSKKQLQNSSIGGWDPCCCICLFGGLAMDLEMGHDRDCGNERTLRTSFAFVKPCFTNNKHNEMSLNFYRVKEIDLKDFLFKITSCPLWFVFTFSF